MAVSLFALIGCCLLAWWQWTRFQSASGTLQNLGYVLQWPLFGLFPGFMFYRIHRAGQAERPEPGTQPETGVETRGAAVSEAPPKPEPEDWPDELTYVQNRTIDHSDEDPALAQYNSYLATLSAQEHRNDR